MKNFLIRMSLLTLLGTLMSCSTTLTPHQQQNHLPDNTVAHPGTEQLSTAPVAGKIENRMDDNDKNKLSHALDKSLGKSTTWTNQNTQITYTVVPTEKFAIEGNPYCRKYTVTSMHNSAQHDIRGTACVSTVDSSWKVINTH